MSSWFGTNSKAELVSSPRNSLDKPQKRAFSTAHSTPHDAILAELLPSPDRVASPDSASHTDVNLLSKNMSPTPSLHPYQPSRLLSTDLLLDPFDGTSLGTLVPHSQDSEVQPDHHSPSQINLASPESGPSSTANAAIPSELVWSHLTNILDLQSQISKMHNEMEGIGSAKAADAKTRGHIFSPKPTPSNVSTAGGKQASSEDPLVPPGLNTRERGLSMASTISSGSGGDPEGDEENVDVPSEEAEKSKAREEEFASLAHQFEGRKEAINNIMGKLDDLFTVLSEFHALQAPSLDFPSSRQGPLQATPPIAGGNDTKTGIASSQTPSTCSYDRTHAQHASSSSAVSPPVLSRTQSDNVYPEAATRKVALLKKSLPPMLLVNSMDLAWEDSTHNSPPSTLGSLKLEN